MISVIGGRKQAGMAVKAMYRKVKDIWAVPNRSIVIEPEAT